MKLENLKVGETIMAKSKLHGRSKSKPSKKATHLSGQFKEVEDDFTALRSKIEKLIKSVVSALKDKKEKDPISNRDKENFENMLSDLETMLKDVS